MMMRKFLSYLIGSVIGILIVAPVIDYEIPVWVNSFHWCWTVTVCGMFGMLLVTKKIHLSLKLLAVYLFALCFISQCPYLSFNSYFIIVPCFYTFYWLQKSDFNVVINFIEAAFWLEVVLTIFQLMGHDTLMNFDRSEKVFLGTVMQYMRFASVLAIMSPFLLIKSKWYAIPLVILCVISKSSTFALALISGVGTWGFLTFGKRIRWIVLIGILILVSLYLVYDWGSFRGAVIPSNGGRLISWINVVQTWIMDTSKDLSYPMLEGPINWRWVFFGHGTDTFLPLFPIYKHDINPFPQAHNDWLQLGWETGLIGLGLILWYVVQLIRKLYRYGEYEYVSGAVCISVVMFFAFPMRMTQSILLIVAYLAFCQTRINKLRSF